MNEVEQSKKEEAMWDFIVFALILIFGFLVGVGLGTISIGLTAGWL